jgi:DNA-binding CsgD family transcriptional regulator
MTSSLTDPPALPPSAGDLTPVSSSEAPAVFSNPQGRPRIFAEGTIFAPQELLVVRHLLDGLTYQETAESLGISIATVKTYRPRAGVKIGVTPTAMPLLTSDQRQTAFIDSCRKHLEAVEAEGRAIP